MPITHLCFAFALLCFKLPNGRAMGSCKSMPFIITCKYEQVADE